ncbi:hypothetical protein MAR_014405 [Mya arenaria]|uniref:Uncharacterized protein n=1 Tax=Mya arenaria TaxID=6604 RepID=A0ABY7G6L9_MYAAR|nr:hypothetical protein MAR_014405 [Mya arenaria]
MKAIQMILGFETACENSYFHTYSLLISGTTFKMCQVLPVQFHSGKVYSLFMWTTVDILQCVVLFLIEHFFIQLFNPKRFVDEEEEKTNNPQAPSTDQTIDDSGDIEPCSGFNVSKKVISLLKFLFLEAKSAFSNTTVQIWSIWWALAACGKVVFKWELRSEPVGYTFAVPQLLSKEAPHL